MLKKYILASFFVLILNLTFSECVGTTTVTHSQNYFVSQQVLWYTSVIIGSLSFLTGGYLLWFYAPKAVAIASTWLYYNPPVITSSSMCEYLTKLDNFGRDISVFNFEDIPFETVVGIFNVQSLLQFQVQAFTAFSQGDTFNYLQYAFPSARPAYFALCKIPTFYHWGQVVHFMGGYYSFENGGDLYWLAQIANNLG